jgi:hydroxypyruvate isomerase
MRDDAYFKPINYGEVLRDLRLRKVKLRRNHEIQMQGLDQAIHTIESLLSGKVPGETAEAEVGAAEAEGAAEEKSREVRTRGRHGGVGS